MARILSIDSAASLKVAVHAAAEVLRNGQVVVVPTETVYGLAANALDKTAVQQIFTIKGRPSANPLIVHVASLEAARGCASEWPSCADLLAKSFWPGPLTMVLPKAGIIPPIVTASGPTVAIRWPSHPFMRALLAECEFPLAAPSANLSTEVSATLAEHTQKSLGDKVPLIIDAGPAAVGIESTVLNLTENPPRILRPGMISRLQIERALGCSIAHGPTSGSPSAPLASPGLLPKHYSPKARVVIAEWDSPITFNALLNATAMGRAAHVLAHSNIPPEGPRHTVSLIPFDPEAYARALYAELHQADQRGVDVIVIEALPSSPEWDGINDRLRRAAHPG